MQAYSISRLLYGNIGLVFKFCASFCIPVFDGTYFSHLLPSFNFFQGAMENLLKFFLFHFQFLQEEWSGKLCSCKALESKLILNFLYSIFNVSKIFSILRFFFHCSHLLLSNRCCIVLEISADTNQYFYLIIFLIFCLFSLPTRLKCFVYLSQCFSNVKFIFPAPEEFSQSIHIFP